MSSDNFGNFYRHGDAVLHPTQYQQYQNQRPQPAPRHIALAQPLQQPHYLAFEQPQQQQQQYNQHNAQPYQQQYPQPLAQRYPQYYPSQPIPPQPVPALGLQFPQLSFIQNTAPQNTSHPYPPSSVGHAQSHDTSNSQQIQSQNVYQSLQMPIHGTGTPQLQAVHSQLDRPTGQTCHIEEILRSAQQHHSTQSSANSLGTSSESNQQPSAQPSTQPYLSTPFASADTDEYPYLTQPRPKDTHIRRDLDQDELILWHDPSILNHDGLIELFVLTEMIENIRQHLPPDHLRNHRLRGYLRRIWHDAAPVFEVRAPRSPQQ